MEHNQTTKKKSAWLRLLRPAILLLMTVFLFSYVSYAWLKRDWTPSIKQEGITISTSSSLVFLFDDSEDVENTMRVDQILDLDRDFVLRPVSNATGKSEHFFALNMSGEKSDYHYQHLSPPAASIVPDYSQLGIDNGYIEFQMALGSNDKTASTQYIYLHPDSHINFSGAQDSEGSQAVNCIRVSITIGSGSESRTIIFVPSTVDKDRHTGINPATDDSYVSPDDGSEVKYLMDGVKFYDRDFELLEKHEDQFIVISPPIESNTEIKHLKDCMAGWQEHNGEETFAPTAENTLFTLTVDPNDTTPSHVWITVRIWAEGTDPDCDDKIAGKQIDLQLKFAAIKAVQ